MRFHKDVSFRLFIREQANKYVSQDEPDSDAKDRFRTRIGEWKTSDKKGVYGEAKEVGGIHGDDIAQTAVSFHTLELGRCGFLQLSLA